MPRPVRSAPPPEPPTEPPDDTASIAAPPPVAPDEPALPWFDRPTPPNPMVEASSPPEAPAGVDTAPPPPEARAEGRDESAGSDDDLFERREPPPLHVPAAPEDDFGGLPTSEHRPDHEPAPRTPEHVPEWAWPSALDDSRGETALPRAVDLDAARAPVTPEPVRPPPRDTPLAAPAAAKGADPDPTRTLGNIRRLMLASNLFVVVAIGAVLAVVGYRIYHTAPAAPPASPMTAPAPAKIPLDMTLTLPRGARIVQTAVADDRLVITLEIDGATEIRTFDIKSLQPTGRMSFATVP